MRNNYQFSINNFQTLSGFTLIEMLVTIAIIAIVSGAVIVGINPAKRIQDAQDSRAKMDVRAAASAVEACLSYVDPTTQVSNGATNCNSSAKLTTSAPGAPFTRTLPSLIIFYGSSTTNVCLYEQGSTTPQNFWYYTTANGQVLAQAATPSACP